MKGEFKSVRAPLIVAAVTFLTFLPVLQNGFVDLDDTVNLINNPHYRGLGWSQLKWMFTTFHMGHYQPLSWVTLGLDYLIWGMNPTGYHLTSLLIHCANAVLFYFVARRLIAVSSWEENYLTLSAGCAALLFSAHPMRVESVAWVTERRDVLSGLCFLGAIYGYLRANSGSSRRWLGFALAAQFLSLLSKAWAITFPLVLWIIDVYVLKRPARRVLWEKIPFIIVAAPFALSALVAQQQNDALLWLENHGLAARLIQALYGLTFYLWKTLAPLNLAPLYQIHPDFIREPFIISGAVATIALTILFCILRSRWPTVWASWLFMLVVLAPVLGIAQSGLQFVATRYSYLSCMGWAVLAGGILSYWLRPRVQTRRERRRERSTSHARENSLALATAVVLVVLASLTWKQTYVWQNSGTVFEQTIKVDPNSGLAHQLWGTALIREGNYTQAILHLRQAMGLGSKDVAATHNSLGVALAKLGDLGAALSEFQRAAQLDPSDGTAFYNMGFFYARQGEWDKAVQNYQQALTLNPGDADTRAGLARVLAQQGQAEKAEAHFQKAIELTKKSEAKR